MVNQRLKQASHLVSVLFSVFMTIAVLKGFKNEWSFYRWFAPFMVINVIENIILIKNFFKPPMSIDNRASTFLIANICVYSYLMPNYIPLSADIAFLNNSIADSIAMVLFYIPYPIVLLGLFYLGDSFTVLPEANKLVVNGIYKYTRHPLYLAYVIWWLCCIFSYASTVYLLFAVAMFIVFALRIMREEKILVESFPEYKEYAQEVGFLGPIGRWK